MKFLVDNQLPIALARFIEKHGHDCKHVMELQLDEADDSTIWRYAASAGRVIITKDQDFLRLASRPEMDVSLVWVRLPNC